MHWLEVVGAPGIENEKRFLEEETMPGNGGSRRQVIIFVARHAPITFVIVLLTLIAVALGEIALEIDDLRTELAGRNDDVSTMDAELMPATHGISASHGGRMQQSS
jgi:hypothetical protein